MYKKLQSTQQAPTTVNTAGFSNAIQKPQTYTAPSMNIANPGATVVNHTDLLNNAKQQGAAQYNVAVPDARFQNADHMNTLVQQMMQMYQPQIQQQQQQLQQQYGQADTRMQEQLAARGMLSSGMGADQQRALQQSLAQELSGVIANAQASAIPNAMNFANIGLSEQDMMLGQQNQNRAFDYGQQSDLYDRLYGINRAQTSDNQWTQDFDLRKYQTELDRFGMESGLNQQAQESYMNDLYRAMGMDIDQNQWAQGMTSQQNQWAGGLASEQDMFGRNLAQQGSQFDRNLSQQQREFNASHALQQASQRDYAAELGLKREMFGWDKERALAGDLGYYVDRTSSDPEGWNKNYTMQGQQFNQEQKDAEIFNRYSSMQGFQQIMEPFLDKKTKVEDGRIALQDMLNQAGASPEDSAAVIRGYYARRGVIPPAERNNINTPMTTEQQLQLVLEELMRGGDYR